LTAAKNSGDNDGRRNRKEEGEEFGGASAEADDNDSRSIRAIVPHELERVDEEDGEQLAKQEEVDGYRRARRVEFGRPRAPQPMSLGTPHLSEDEDRCLHSPRLPTVIDELFQCLTTLSSKLESAEHVASATRRTKHHTGA
jgi:hypothetical protein